MDDQFLESLLYRSEDSSVDFKAEQYVFSKVDAAKLPHLSKADTADWLKSKKSELLKDIIAMCNSWRDGTAFILIGFKENKPHPPTVVGIEPDAFYDDAAFQQFIGGKVGTKIDFKYEVRTFRGKAIGVISIPRQPRPVFAKENYGKVVAQVVYVRRGSSTVQADPAEIASMGAADQVTRQVAVVDIGLVDSNGSDIDTSKHEIHIVDFGDIRQLPDYANPSSSPLGIDLNTWQTNLDFWRELAEWAIAGTRAIFVQFNINNRSAFSLNDCKAEVEVVWADDGKAVSLGIARDTLRQPSKSRTFMPAFDRPRLAHPFAHSGVSVDKAGSAVIWIDKVRPGEQAKLMEDALAFLPDRAGEILVRIKLMANELPEPLQFERRLTVEASRVQWDMAKLKAIAARL